VGHCDGRAFRAIIEAKDNFGIVFSSFHLCLPDVSPGNLLGFLESTIHIDTECVKRGGTLTQFHDFSLDPSKPVMRDRGRCNYCQGKGSYELRSYEEGAIGFGLLAGGSFELLPPS
jgi:hypothetical protein